MTNIEKKNAYRYFIYNMQEYLKSDYDQLESRTIGSFRALLLDYFELYAEINSCTGDKGKYQKSLDNLLNSIIFYCKENPISRHPHITNDIQSLKKLLELKEKSEQKDKSEPKDNSEKKDKSEPKDKSEKKDKIDPFCIYNTISSVYKKFSSINILYLCIDMVQNYIKDYADVDKITEVFISELIFEGYSLKYLEEWFGQTFRYEVMKGISDEEGLKNVIGECMKLSCKSNKCYSIILKVSLPYEIKKEIKENKTICISNVEYQSIYLENVELITSKKFDKFYESGKFEYLTSNIKSCDIYKSIELVKLPLENYMEMYKTVDTSIKNKIINGCLISEDSEWREIPLHNEETNFKKMTLREKEDIQDFIQLRSFLRKNHIMSIDIDLIERVINLLQKVPELTKDNRLLNTWTSMEYILKSYNKESIIEKVRQVVPRVICLYIFKNKMNILWDKLLPYIERGKTSDLNHCISSDNPKKYDRLSFATFLKDKDSAQKLHDFFGSNIIIQRKIAELNCILNNPQQLINLNKYSFSAIQHDLNSIYRLRNKLVHSGVGNKLDIDLYSNKLQKYVNCVLGTIIYHIKRSPESTISEVLYSIVQTYDNYLGMLQALITDKDPCNQQKLLQEKIMKIAFPPYLYL